MTSDQEPMLNQAATSAGLKAFTAAFVIGTGCTPIWGDTLPVTSDSAVTGEIATAEADGAQPIVSFGGEPGTELADSCSSLSQLTAAYQSVIGQPGRAGRQRAGVPGPGPGPGAAGRAAPGRMSAGHGPCHTRRHA